MGPPFGMLFAHMRTHTHCTHIYKDKCVSVLNQAPRREYVEGSGGKAHAFLISAVNGNEWVASRPGRLPPEKELPILMRQEDTWVPESV
jgi:hypothetical protein